MGISLLEGSSRGVAVLCTTNTSTAFCTLHLKGNEAHKGPSSQLGFPAQAGHICTTERMSDLENHHEQWVSTAQTTGRGPNPKADWTPGGLGFQGY